MENALLLSLSNQMVTRRTMDVIANNIANMNTSGFKAERQMFAQFLLPKDGSVTANDRIAMVSDFGTYHDTSGGPIQNTGNPLDIALSGEGYLSVQGPSGVLYTRTGSMTIANDGTLSDHAGHPILDESGSPILIQQDDKAITISEDGIVSASRGQIAKIGVFKFARPNFLAPLGGGLFQAKDPAQVDPDTKIRQGSLEGSNVQPITEMTQMIDVQRSYETVSALLQAQTSDEKDMIIKLSNTTA